MICILRDYKPKLNKEIIKTDDIEKNIFKPYCAKFGIRL